MKKILFFVITVMIVISLSAQNKKEVKISEKVKSVLTKLYPDAKDIQWKKNKNKTEAAFTNNGKIISVIFHSDQLYSTRIQIQASELPKAVKESLNEYYQGYKIIYVGIISDTRYNVFYATELKKTTVLIKVMFDKNGNLVRSGSVPD